MHRNSVLRGVRVRAPVGVGSVLGTILNLLGQSREGTAALFLEHEGAEFCALNEPDHWSFEIMRSVSATPRKLSALNPAPEPHIRVTRLADCNPAPRV